MDLISAKGECGIWLLRNDIVLARGWSLLWTTRETNASVDMAAKLALKEDRDLWFHEFNFIALPSVLFFQLLAEATCGSSSL